MAYRQDKNNFSLIKLTWESEKIVSIIVPVENNKAWIATWGADRMTLIDEEGKFIDKTEKIEEKIIDAKQYNSDLLVTSTKSHRVMRLSQYPKSRTIFHEFESSFPKGLCIDENQVVLVCLVSEKDSKSGYDDKNAKVVKLNKNGEEIRAIQFDDCGCPLFGWPISVTSLPTGEIVIVDRGSDERVLFLDKSDKCLGEWRGLVAGEMMIECLHFVANAKLCRVFVTDEKGVFMLLRNGNEAMCICDESMGITKPTAIAINSKRELMIGTAGGKIHIIDLNDYRLRRE